MEEEHGVMRIFADLVSDICNALGAFLAFCLCTVAAIGWFG